MHTYTYTCITLYRTIPDTHTYIHTYIHTHSYTYRTVAGWVAAFV